MHRKKEYSVCIISRIYPLPKTILIDLKRQYNSMIFSLLTIQFIITFHIQPSRYSQNFLIYQISLHHEKKQGIFLRYLTLFSLKIFQLFIFNIILLHVYSNYYFMPFQFAFYLLYCKIPLICKVFHIQVFILAFRYFTICLASSLSF